MWRVLLVPSNARGNGSGHLVRCLSLARELGPEASVYVPREPGPSGWSAAEITLAFPGAADDLILDRIEPGRSFDLVVLDRRSTDRETLETYQALGPVIALDEGGPARGSVSYLVDTLPRPPGGRHAIEPNLASRGFLDLPAHRRESPREARRALLAFGGEDPAGLGPALARFLVEGGFFAPERLTLVSGALSRPDASRAGLPQGIAVLAPVQNLKEHLSSWDLVFTSFGLTAYEAAWAGCLVALLDPSPYHAALSREAGFPSIGVRRPRAAALRALLSDIQDFAARSAAPAPKARESLAKALADFSSKASGRCPACASARREALARFPRKSYFRCLSCGLVHMEHFLARPASYVKPYFFEEYKAQYGRTYLEDWPKLTELAASRLDLIDALVPAPVGGSGPRTVLDVGCAYGAFLAEAKRRRWQGYGLDIAEDAVAYVRDSLGIPAMAADFQDPRLDGIAPDGLDCVSLWYVIEHFEALGDALRRAARLLKPGGILAMATPSLSGVSARADLRAFLERSPDDHLSIWEPGKVAAFLRPYGLRVERIRVTGHHPERFPGASPSDAPWRARLRLAASHAFGLGDTFEIYARRIAPKGSTT